MSRSALPQNYTVNNGLLLEDFENTGNWTVSTDCGGTIATDTVRYRTGTQSIKFTLTNGYVSITKAISTVINPRIMHLWVYIHTARDTFYQVEVRLSSAADMSKRFYAYFNLANLVEGWNLLTVHRDNWTCVNGESWSNTMIRLKVAVYTASGKSLVASLDNLHYNTEKLARCLIQFDDARDSAFSEGYTYMNSRGLAGSVYINSDRIGASGYMTVDNLTTLYNAGWALSNHTSDHSDLSLLTQAEAEAKIADCTNWLIAHGFPRAAKHFAYPLGHYNSSTLAAVDATGMLTARTSWTGSYSTPVGDLRLTLMKGVWRTTTLAGARAMIDQALKLEMTIALVFHELVASPAIDTQWTITDFRALIDYIVACKIPCATIDEWYEGLTNTRYRSLPLSRIGVA